MTEDGMVARVTTDSGSPWFTGHFPGDPILPGIAKEVRSVVLQDWDLDRMECRWSRHLLDNGKNTTLEGNLRLEVLDEEAGEPAHVHLWEIQLVEPLE